jgi:hypothetical protein
MDTVWQWIVAHQTTVTLVAYYIFAAFVGALPMPDNESGKFYRFFFAFINAIAANISRASAVPAQQPKPLDLNPPKP